MKCIAVVVMLTLACANAYILPMPYHPHAYAVSPWEMPAIVDGHHEEHYHGHHHHHHEPAVPLATSYAYQWSAPVVSVPVRALQNTVVTQTRDIFRTVPSSEQVVSQTTFNVAPAVGGF